ncbi:unnamed protein product [Kuraishia capsulata CBS 1993]|uniref:UBX domain-containing protein n=1 Tax=Kuraishia capsulata CBS 1993 TaxID=1382522 RepID=W6MH40_9ASCO|nr:uncharacterized protein KUCA_T00000925001 [Kuraishia capsulata CBS 1993]CDK24958.1 unnamed protein product [Kuraishia capsulata CBS 1993]
MDGMIDMFLAVTDTSDRRVAEQFLEMAGNDVDTAISLFLEHGGGASSGTANATDSIPDDDEAFAARLQNEAYQEVRAPQEAVHEQLIDSYHPVLNHVYQDPSRAMFGDNPAGIFNQRLDTDFSDDDADFVGAISDEEDENIDYDDDDNDDDLMVLDDDLNATRPRRTTAARRRQPASAYMTSSQRRLANIFRPPWDIIEKLSLDAAKIKARQEKKWILINIQDVGDFQCQVLNRDFWSNADVKDVVRENFIFLQYQNSSPSGSQYAQFYPIGEFPHIAILDPMTGERLKIWDRVPKVSDWISDVVDFLVRFSLDPSHKNPTVTHEHPLDVDALSEEQQINLAMQKSMNNSDTDMKGGDEANPISLDSDNEVLDKEDGEQEEPTEADIIAAIKPIEHEEPAPDPQTTTRVQIRSGDGKRVVRRFRLEDSVRNIYEYVKATFDQLGDATEFVLTSQRLNLITELDKTILEAGLKNATILLEIVG